MRRSVPYYCIAIGRELWFERLDFGVLAIWPGTSQGTSQGRLSGGGSCGISCHPAECFGVLSRERERHEGVEGPNGPAVAGVGGGGGGWCGGRGGGYWSLGVAGPGDIRVGRRDAPGVKNIAPVVELCV